MTKTEKNYLKSIELLGEQIKQSYQEAGEIKLPASYGQVNKIVACGMGGSQLGVDLVSSLFAKELKVPIIQVRDYQLPGFVDEKTLVLLISYSGTTEEVLSISSKLKTPFGSAQGRQNLKLIVITTGGRLAQIARKNHWPLYKFEPKNNPSGQPRMGTGYVIGSLLAILKKLQLIKVSGDQLNDILKLKTPFGSAQGRQNLKLKTKNLKNKIIVIVAAEHLAGNAHIIANQINESAKQFACYFILPELNHHLLEGLAYPRQKNIFFLFLNSKNYHPHNQKRFQITQEVLKKQKIGLTEINFAGPLRRIEASSKIIEALSFLYWGGQLSYQLAKLNRVNPNFIPWVNYLKKKLS